MLTGEFILGIMALLSVTLHGWMIHAAEGGSQRGRLLVYHPYSLLQLAARVTAQAEAKWNKEKALHSLAWVWTFFIIYHFLVWTIFRSMLLIHLVNLLTVTLTSIYLLEALRRVQGEVWQAWRVSPSHRFLYTTVIYWEAVLAGSVLLLLLSK